MNQFCFVGICAGLAMLMLMIMPSSIADDELEINVEGDKNAIVYVNETDTVSTVKEKIVEQLTKNINEEIDIIKEKLIGNKNKTHKLMETLKVNVNENIKILEAKLEEKNYENNEILPARITLRLNENGSPLEDGKTMKECGIVKDTVPKTIYLTWDELEIKVKGDKNVKNVIVYVKDTDKVSELKLKIIEKLKVNVNENIKILEAKLEEKKKEKNKILTARKTLRLDKNGSPFEDGKTISEYVKNGAIVFLELEGYEIFVDYKGKTYTIWVNKEDTVYELKEKIQKVIQIRHSEQKLSFPYYNIVPDHRKTMQFYDIGKNDSLLLKRQLYIGCHYKDKDYFPIVEETEKVSSVKDMVKAKIQEKSGIQLKNIRLSYYDGKVLEDDAEIGSYDRIDSTMVQVSRLEQSSGDENTSPLLND